MLRLLLRLRNRNRRQILAKLCIFLLVTIVYFFKKTALFRRRPPLDTSKHIIFNLRALNHSLPHFIAEIPPPNIFDDEPNVLSIFPRHLSTESLNFVVTTNSTMAGSDTVDEKVDSDLFTMDNSIDFGNQSVEVTTENLDLKYEEMIKMDEKNIIEGLGENGVPVQVVPDTDPALVKAIMKKEAFNKMLSDKISLTRNIPDARHHLCTTVTYDEELPSASVIIIFIDEAWSTLLRTVHSVLSRSPDKFLKEIVLVDDASTRFELGGKLDYYIKTRLPSNKVRLVRLGERHGLIRARLAGAEAAIADTLVFLDSHCECVVGWLEPLLQRIKDKNDAVVCPVIDVISDKNMAYSFGQDRGFQIGSFSWSGHFTWTPVPDFEKQRLKSPVAPTRSPTMAGGLFAIDAAYFWRIGSYDQGMDIWGGENLEISFRIWQCGGTLEIIPCSRVGHIFRTFHPYSFPKQKDTHGINTARMAEVWMDEYKRLFYMHRPDLKVINIGDITDRKLLRERLRCKDFRWFLKNVVPQKFIPDENVQAYGRVKSYVRNFCFDNLNQGEDDGSGIGIYNCHNVLYPSQFYSLSLKGELRREERCAQIERGYINVSSLVGGAKGKVVMVNCNSDPKQVWKYNNQMIRNAMSGLCIHIHGAERESYVTVADCRQNDMKFKWTWEYLLMKNGSGYVKQPLTI